MMIICIVIIASLYFHVYKIFYVSSVILLLMFLISPIIWDRIDNQIGLGGVNMTNLEKTALLKGRLAKIEQKNPTSGVARKIKRQIRNLSK